MTVSTDLKITGKAAQFGRGVMADISKKLMAQFADNLSELITGDTEVEDTATQEETPSERTDEAESVRILDSEEVEAVNLLSTAGAPVLKRALLLIAIAAAIAIVIFVIVN